MSSETPRKIPVRFYRSAGGQESVRDWLKRLDARDRLAIGRDLMRVQFRWPVGMPLCRSLGSGLWEVRTQLPSRRIARVMICFREDALVVLHAFIKKTQRMSDEDMDVARRRQKEVGA
jgi:phage-related protein